MFIGPFDRFIFVELKLTTVAAGATLNFADVPQLNNAKIQAIEAYSDTQVTKTPTQNTVFANAEVPDMLMTFMNRESDKQFENMPYYTLIRSNNGGYLMRFPNFRVNITASYVWIGATGATVNHALAFGVYYSNGK